MSESSEDQRQGGWNVSRMKEAVHAVLTDGMTQKHAAETYNVPRQTLRRYLIKAKDDNIRKDLDYGKVILFYKSHIYDRRVFKSYIYGFKWYIMSRIDKRTVITVN